MSFLNENALLWADCYSIALGSDYMTSEVTCIAELAETGERMIERLRLSKGWLSKMIKAGAISDEVLAAFPDLSALTLNPAYALATAMDNPERAKTIRYVAGRIGEKNEAAKEDGRPPLPHAEVYQTLMTAGIVEPDPPLMYAAKSQYGRMSMEVTAANRQGMTIRVYAASGSTDDELVERFREAIAHHMPTAAGANAGFKRSRANMSAGQGREASPSPSPVRVERSRDTVRAKVDLEINVSTLIRSTVAGLSDKAVGGHMTDETIDLLRRECPGWDLYTDTSGTRSPT